MILFWKIRYLDRADKQFKDRCLYLRTKTLDPVTRAAVEFVIQNKSSKTQRDLLKYRHLFTEDATGTGPADPNSWEEFRGFALTDYFEDETGKEITLYEMGPIPTGSPTTVLVPGGTKQHDIDLMFAEPKPIPVAEVSLNTEELRLFGSSATLLETYKRWIPRPS